MSGAGECRLLFGQPDGGGPFAGEFTLLPMEKVLYGPGILSALADEVDHIGATRFLLVTGQTLAARTDIVDRVQHVLGEKCVGVFAESAQHVPRASVLAAAECARELGADGVVSCGGGSPIDTAKGVAMCLSQDLRRSSDFEPLHFRMDNGHLVMPPIPGAMIPHLSVSTTLSGAEFTGFTGITDPARLCKDVYAAAELTPRVVLLDPELTAATPGWLWASTGMRAVDHCVESVYSLAHQPFADALCLRALEMLVSSLPRAISDPDDVIARGACQVAMWMSIFSLPNIPAGMSHGIGHQLGARCNLPHGICSAIMLPEVMDYNRPATASRQRLIADALGIDVGGHSDNQAAAAASQRLREFVAELGIKNRLSDWGIQAEDLPAVARDAVDDFMNATNPVPVTDPEVIVRLLRSVL